MHNSHVWALVLAAGEGSRLRSLTMTSAGIHVPKQFCSLVGGPSLMLEALCRARSIAPDERICTIVAAEHRRWWEGSFPSLPASNVLVQPRNRGTAIGILLPLMYVLERDPDAQLVVLPSDHYVQNELTLTHSLLDAIAEVAMRPEEIVLLGMRADEPDPELGYIVPGKARSNRVFDTVEFVEKPPPSQALMLVESGALWNAFVVATDGQALLKLFERRFPEIVREMRRVVRGMMAYSHLASSLAELYSRLPVLDFSRAVLEGELHGSLRVLPVPACGWTDLGTPRRIAETVRRLSDGHRQAAMVSGKSAQLILADRSEEWLRADRVAAGNRKARLWVRSAGIRDVPNPVAYQDDNWRFAPSPAGDAAKPPLADEVIAGHSERRQTSRRDRCHGG